jgi:hypothetical protein
LLNSFIRRIFNGKSFENEKILRKYEHSYTTADKIWKCLTILKILYYEPGPGVLS